MTSPPSEPPADVQVGPLKFDTRRITFEAMTLVAFGVGIACVARDAHLWPASAVLGGAAGAGAALLHVLRGVRALW
jgi:hypothetical protein